jgi:MFS family permease
MARDQAPIAAETARRRWVVLALLILVNTLSMADRNIMLAAQEAIKHQFHLTDTQVGSLTGLVFGLTYAIASVPMGVLADRTDKGRLLAAAQVVWSGATALAAAAWGYASLFGLRFVVGLSEATCVPTGLALIADHFPQKERAGAFSLFNLGVPIGTGASLALGGIVIAHWGWRTGLLIAGLGAGARLA